MFLLNFFDEYLGLALDVIPAFTTNNWEYWLDILGRLEIMMARLGKHHYRDAIMATLSITDYWKRIQHHILETMTAKTYLTSQRLSWNYSFLVIF